MWFYYLIVNYKIRVNIEADNVIGKWSSNMNTESLGHCNTLQPI
jgi:hypothetical protein